MMAITNETNKKHDAIIIEGVVGVGKTALMELLINKGYVPFNEPIEDNPILDKFYYNRERYAFTLQIFFLSKRFEQIHRASEIENVIMDRSIYGDAIFAKVLNQTRELSSVEYEIFIELLNNMLTFVRKPKLLIYLSASTEEIIKQIRARGRDYELEVESEYWDRLNKAYEEYFESYVLSPMLKIDVDGLDFKNNPLDQEYVISLIENELAIIERAEQ